MQTKKNKVALVINDFFVGGAQRLLSEQIKHFNTEKFDITLVVLMDNPSRATLYHTLPSNLKIIHVSMKHPYYPSGLIRFFRALKEVKPNVVVSHLFLSNVLTRVFEPFLGYRLYSVEHNTYVGKKWRHVWADRILSVFSQGIIAVSAEVAEFSITQQRLNKNKVVVIPNGIDLKPIKEYSTMHSKSETRLQLGIADSTMVFISVGRLTPQKNQKLLVTTFMDFSKVHQNARLYILGEGSLMSELRHLIGENTSIVLVGNVSNVFEYYRSADFLVSTSIIEGMSMAYLEAMAFGIPIIATKTGGTREIVDDGKNGFLIPSLESSAVIEALNKVITCSYKEISTAAIKKAEHFSIEENVLQYERLFY